MCGIHMPYAHVRTNDEGAGAGARGNDITDFDQRRLHKVVVKRARQEFLKGNYLGAIAGAHMGLERLVRAKSGINEHGAGLMARALGTGGVLEVDPDGLTDATRDSMQRGLVDMCVKLVSSVQNRIRHEPEASLRIGREDALHILGAISYLCGQVEQARCRSGQERRLPKGNTVHRSSPMPKSGRSQSVRKAGARATDADCHCPPRDRGKRTPRRRKLLDLPWLQAVGILSGIIATAIMVAGALAQVFG